MVLTNNHKYTTIVRVNKVIFIHIKKYESGPPYHSLVVWHVVLTWNLFKNVTQMKSCLRVQLCSNSRQINPPPFVESPIDLTPLYIPWPHLIVITLLLETCTCLTKLIATEEKKIDIYPISHFKMVQN